MSRGAILAFLVLLACACRWPDKPPETAAEAPAVEEAESTAAKEPAAPEIELSPVEHDRRGDEHLRAGRFAEAIADFDLYLEAHPEHEAHHWRRGIAYYYAGEYEAGVSQFELHRTVNPNDVENATWHFLCMVRARGIDAARDSLLPVGPDPRLPMATVYELFAGRAEPEEVEQRAAGSASGLFYGHLYLGLWYEANGDAERTRHHIELAATTHAQPHYMGDVARVHHALLQDE